MTRAIYDKYVHEFVDRQGVTRYAVAAWNQASGQYTSPLTRVEQKLTGCSSEFCRDLNYFGGYTSRRDALRRARYLFGLEEEGEE